MRPAARAATRRTSESGATRARRNSSGPEVARVLGGEHRRELLDDRLLLGRGRCRPAEQREHTTEAQGPQSNREEYERLLRLTLWPLRLCGEPELGRDRARHGARRRTSVGSRASASEASSASRPPSRWPAGGRRRHARRRSRTRPAGRRCPGPSSGPGPDRRIGPAAGSGWPPRSRPAGAPRASSSR